MSCRPARCFLPPPNSLGEGREGGSYFLQSPPFGTACHCLMRVEPRITSPAARAALRQTEQRAGRSPFARIMRSLLSHCANSYQLLAESNAPPPKTSWGAAFLTPSIGGGLRGWVTRAQARHSAPPARSMLSKGGTRSLRRSSRNGNYEVRHGNSPRESCYV